VLDGNDANPLTPKHIPDDLAEIRQAAFSIEFATCNSRDILHLVDDGREWARQEYHGFSGWVLPIASKGNGVNIVKIDISRISATSAEVEVADYEGPLAAGSRSWELAKKHGKWVAVASLGGWVS
jgi:hypothetical protein